MDKYSFLSLLLTFFNACVLTVPIVANTGKLFPLYTKQLHNSVVDSTKSCPNTGIALNKLVITVAKS